MTEFGPDVIGEDRSAEGNYIAPSDIYLGGSSSAGPAPISSRSLDDPPSLIVPVQSVSPSWVLFSWRIDATVHVPPWLSAFLSDLGNLSRLVLSPFLSRHFLTCIPSEFVVGRRRGKAYSIHFNADRILFTL